MAELVDALDSKSCGLYVREGSSPSSPTIFNITAGVVQRLVCKFSKLEIGFRLPSPAPEKVKITIYGYF